MPMNKKDYPCDWVEISLQVRISAGWKCELCDAKQNNPHWKTGSNVILTVHHIDGDKRKNGKLNLIALCQRCHLRLDLQKHIKNRKENKLRKEMLVNENTLV